MWIMILLLQLTHAQLNRAPSAMQLCLDDAGALKTLMDATECKSIENTSDSSNEICEQCVKCKTTKKEKNIDYLVPNVLGADTKTAGIPLDPEIKKNYCENEFRSCKDKNTHKMTCKYSPDQKDGTPAGDDPNTTAEDCKIPLKSDSAGKTQP
jgi:hypothetical protein